MVGQASPRACEHRTPQRLRQEVPERAGHGRALGAQRPNVVRDRDADGCAPADEAGEPEARRHRAPCKASPPVAISNVMYRVPERLGCTTIGVPAVVDRVTRSAPLVEARTVTTVEAVIAMGSDPLAGCGWPAIPVVVPLMVTVAVPVSGDAVPPSPRVPRPPFPSPPLPIALDDAALVDDVLRCDR